MPEPLPSQRPPSAPKAPRPLRLKAVQATTNLPPGAGLLVDSLVGTIYGSTRSEVLRFIVLSWITEHHATAIAISESRRRQHAEESKGDQA
jgi:hypothetical protein